MQAEQDREKDRNRHQRTAAHGDDARPHPPTLDPSPAVERERPRPCQQHQSRHKVRAIARHRRIEKRQRRRRPKRDHQRRPQGRHERPARPVTPPHRQRCQQRQPHERYVDRYSIEIIEAQVPRRDRRRFAMMKKREIPRPFRRLRPIHLQVQGQISPPEMLRFRLEDPTELIGHAKLRRTPKSREIIPGHR